MNWILKAFIQNMIAALPKSISEGVYYRMQRNFGALRHTSPLKHVERAVEIATLVQRTRVSGEVAGIYLEVGTGRTLNVPIALWLCGATGFFSVDLNSYLRQDVVIENLMVLVGLKEDQLRLYFGQFAEDALFWERLQKLQACRRDLAALQELVGLCYLAPADVSNLWLEADSVDVHFSVNVLEHVHPEGIERILEEAKRILVPGGIAVHRIDLTDHFSHSDKRINPIHFLKFSPFVWNLASGNRYMYQNRLRATQYKSLFSQVGFNLLSTEDEVNSNCLGVLRDGFEVHKEFKAFTPEDLATISLKVVAET